MSNWLNNTGIGLHWREDGTSSGRPVMLLNSLGTDLRLWDSLVDMLSDTRVIRLDTRGHGLSDAPVGPYSLEALTGDALALIDHLKLTDLTVIGVSLGGMMAQSIAAQRPSLVRALVLSNTGLRMGTPAMWQDRIDAISAGGMAAIADAVLERWFAPDFRHSENVGRYRNMLLRTPVAGYAGACAALAQADVSVQAKAHHCPALVIAGADDLASPPDLVREVAGSIPNGQFEIIANSGHLPMVDAAPAFETLVRNFLNSTDP
jgi:3-oxoadipate enol-lactonase